MYTPWTNRFVGVELEVYRETSEGDSFDPYEFRSALTRARVPRVGSRDVEYFHSNGNFWDVKTDSSCGYEIASPKLLLTPEGQNDELRTVCTTLHDFNARVTSGCGLHVHVDCAGMSDAHFQRLLRLWVRYEPTWYSLVPASRRTNHYCAPMRQAQFGPSRESPMWERTVFPAQHGTPHNCRTVTRRIGDRGGLNVTSYWNSARVEFRLHSGTISYEKVVRWAALCAAIVHRAQQDDMPEIARVERNEQPQQVSIKHMGRLLGLLPTKTARPDVHPYGATLVQYFESRASQFASVGSNDT